MILPSFEFESEPQHITTTHPDPVLTLTPDEQRRIRRMISNRESARRSRMRKQRHLEDLRCHVGRLRTLNRELTNRVGLVTHQTRIIRSDSDLLRTEWGVLSNKLSEIKQVLMFRQLQRLSLPVTNVAVCGSGFGSGNEQSLASLIT